MTEKCLSKRLPAQAFLLKNEDLKLKKESCRSAFPFSFFVMLCKGSCAVFNAVNHLVQIVDVSFRIKRIGGNFKGNTAFFFRNTVIAADIVSPISFSACSAICLTGVIDICIISVNG